MKGIAVTLGLLAVVSLTASLALFAAAIVFGNPGFVAGGVFTLLAAVVAGVLAYLAAYIAFMLQGVTW